MTAETTIELEGLRLHTAVLRGDFTQAAQSVNRYCQAVSRAAPTASRPEVADLARQSAELLEWARRNLRAQRARLANRLGDIQRLQHYREASRKEVHTWTLRA
jgi:hypothetical protein